MNKPFAAAVLISALTLTSCGTSFPADPDGTLDRVSGGVLRVGASENDDWVTVAASGEPEGSEPALIREFASRLGAEIKWSVGTEHVLAADLKHGELDLVIGGLNDETPWEKEAGLTRPYTESKDSRGKTHKHVMLVAKGENAFLLELDRFLMAKAPK
ncbi:transporter substrate-binding domain-containing protein [Arthrobacter sp. ISL-72]|uniref:transporter substrate-binding domain-containing protein n=1 Tax=Arthrobacter sp. ISL-72 TaxID=2819114 RepID=UPI001BE5834A|nr:transporter substrate-binding domain-containing protein [Arthrobacter sp. ISL-72]MBT2594147.1 transporter substrate-binding domain-containing protein [Arthrobacter sp. ISL-72]